MGNCYRRQAFSAGVAPSIFRAPREREQAADLPKISSRLRHSELSSTSQRDIRKGRSHLCRSSDCDAQTRKWRAEIPHDSPNRSRKFGSPPRVSIVRRQLRSRCGGGLDLPRNLIANSQVPKSTARKIDGSQCLSQFHFLSTENRANFTWYCFVPPQLAQRPISSDSVQNSAP